MNKIELNLSFVAKDIICEVGGAYNIFLGIQSYGKEPIGVGKVEAKGETHIMVATFPSYDPTNVTVSGASYTVSNNKLYLENVFVEERSN